MQHPRRTVHVLIHWRALSLFSLALMLISLSALGAPGVQAAKPPAYFVDQAKLPFSSLPNTQATQYWGVHGGAGYRIEVPTNWNGELVLWAHGYRGNGLELTVSNPTIRVLPHRSWLRVGRLELCDERLRRTARASRTRTTSGHFSTASSATRPARTSSANQWEATSPAWRSSSSHMTT